MDCRDLINALEHEIEGNTNVLQDNPTIEAAQQLYSIALVREFLATHKVEVNKFLEEDQ